MITKEEIVKIIREEIEAELEEAAGEKDACYHKVKSRYKVWPSAYASGALTKCRKVGAKNWGNKTNEEDLEEKLTEKPSSESSLKDWLGRKGEKGSKGGWVDCNTCRKDKKTGRKKCSACGRSTGEKRAKYPSCRPTPGACGKKGDHGKKSKAGKKG